MSAPVRLGVRIRGEEIEQRFRTAGDTIRVEVRKALRALGDEMQGTARTRAPRSAGYRSRTSEMYGPLFDTITPRIYNKKSTIRLSIRPTIFYAYFLEVGYIKSEGKKLDVRKGLVRRTYEDQRRYVLKNTRVATGVRFLQSRDDKLTKVRNIGTRRNKKLIDVPAYRRTFTLNPQPFMLPVWEQYRDRVAGTVNEAIGRALKAGAA